MEPLWPLVLYFCLVLGLLGVMIGLPAVLGERHRDPSTGQPFESGIAPTGSARTRMSAQFYLVAMIFLVFDLEAVFLFAWAAAARDLGWFGFAGMLAFALLLVAGLIYEWREGTLDWGRPPAKKPPRGSGPDA